MFETRAAFYAYLRDAVTGACPSVSGLTADLRPVYRLWSQRADTNHRFTMSPSVRDAMIQCGWIAEGFDPDGVAMCAPLPPP